MTRRIHRYVRALPALILAATSAITPAQLVPPQPSVTLPGVPLRQSPAATRPAGPQQQQTPPQTSDPATLAQAQRARPQEAADQPEPAPVKPLPAVSSNTIAAAPVNESAPAPASALAQAPPAPAGIVPGAAPTLVRSNSVPAVPLTNGLLDEIDLRDSSLRDALTLIGQSSGLNLVASDEAAKVRVTIHLRNVTPQGAVQAICQTHGLFFNRKPTEEGIDVITTVKEFQQGLTVFREEKTEVFTLLYPNALDLAVAIRDIFGDRVHLSRGKDDVFDESDDIQRRFDRFDLLDARSQGLAQSFTSGSSGGSGGGGNSSNSNSRSSSSGSSGSRGGSLNQSQTPRTGGNVDVARENLNLTGDQLDRIAKLIKQEGAGVGVDMQDLAGLGRNTTPIYVSVISRNNQILVRTSDPGVLEEISRLKAKIDIPTPQVLLEVKVLSVDLTDGFRSVFDVQFGDQHNSAGFSSGNILPPPTAGLNIPLAVGGSGAAAGPFALDQTSLIYQWVSNNFRVRMQLLDNANRVTTLATPLLLVANNEVSRVFIGQERPIVRNISSQTTVTQGVSQSTPSTTIEFRPVGTTLMITPNINADRTVTLRLIQENSEIITGGATIPVISNNGGVINEPVDVVSARSLTGTLVAKDGLSLALGGLIEEGVTDTREEVPILGKLPLIGTLFRRQVTGRFRREVIVVIRPFILSTPSEAEATGKRLIEANSIHPKTEYVNPAPGSPIGTMNTYLPHEVLRPNPPKNELEKIFQFHSTLPKTY